MVIRATSFDLSGSKGTSASQLLSIFPWQQRRRNAETNSEKTQQTVTPTEADFESSERTCLTRKKASRISTLGKLADNIKFELSNLKVDFLPLSWSRICKDNWQREERRFDAILKTKAEATPWVTRWQRFQADFWMAKLSKRREEYYIPPKERCHPVLQEIGLRWVGLSFEQTRSQG